jgi:hypothetical protein
MKTMIRILQSLQVVAAALTSAGRGPQPRAPRGLGWKAFLRTAERRPVFANVAAGTHAGSVTRTASGTFTQKYLLAMAGEEDGEIAVAAAASDIPVGVATDQAFDGDPIAMKLLANGAQTVLMVASGAIATGSILYGAANGQVQTVPTTAGTYYLVGRALTAATGQNEQIEAETCLPVKVTVLAALSSDASTALSALAAALGTPGEVIVLGS